MTISIGDGGKAAPLRDAATVVLLRAGAGGPEVLMVRRKKGSAFMADAFVFPGGRVDDGDANSHPLSGENTIARDGRLAQLADDEPRAVSCCVAAIRELFEEAGILLAVDDQGAMVRTDGQSWFTESRRSVHEGTRGFREVLAEQDLALSLGELAFFARWVTPANESRRFDARFFLARMPSGQTATFDETELHEQRWSTPRAILDDYERGTVKLPPPTIWHLTDLTAHRTVESALAWARAREVAVIRPKLVPIDGNVGIVLPWDSEYPSLPGDGTVIARTHPVAGPVTRFVLLDGRWIPRTV